MTLADDIKSDVSAIFLNTDEFAETITYHYCSGGQISIVAIIDREPNAYQDGLNAVMPGFTLEIHNNASTGVLAGKIDTGGDQVTIYAKRGDQLPVKRSVLKILEHDEGAITLAIK